MSRFRSSVSSRILTLARRRYRAECPTVRDCVCESLGKQFSTSEAFEGEPDREFNIDLRRVASPGCVNRCCEFALEPAFAEQKTLVEPVENSASVLFSHEDIDQPRFPSEADLDRTTRF